MGMFTDLWKDIKQSFQNKPAPAAKPAPSAPPKYLAKPATPPAQQKPAAFKPDPRFDPLAGVRSAAPAAPAAKPKPVTRENWAQFQKQAEFGVGPLTPESTRIGPGAQKPAEKPYGIGVWAPMNPSDGVMNLLNEQNWTLPETGKKVEMPKDAFEKDSFKDLKQHDYQITAEEWGRLQAEYSGPRAQAMGFQAPTVNLNETMPLMKMGEQKSAALTWEAYEALSDDQRAAVDFNTLLVKAREEDLSKSWAMDAEKQAAYDEQVAKMFGEGRGSDKIAPNTVDLLSKLDMKVVGQDLDEFLSLERGIDTTELKDFKFSDRDIKTLDDLVNAKPAEAYTQVRADQNIAAIDTAVIKKAQDVIKAAVQNPDALTYSFDTALFGPTTEMQLTGQTPLGYGTPSTVWKDPIDQQKDEYFRQYLTALTAADPSAFGVPAGTDPMSWVLEDMKLVGFTPEEQQMFVDLVENKSSMVGQYGTPDDQKLAGELRKRAGLGG